MIDLYYWQRSPAGGFDALVGRLGGQIWRDETKRKEEICLGWDPPDEARSVVGTGRAGCPKRQPPVLSCHSPLTSATPSGDATSMAQSIFRPWNLSPRSGLEPKKSCSFSTR
jgi:hypothetical protein